MSLGVVSNIVQKNLLCTLLKHNKVASFARIQLKHTNPISERVVITDDGSTVVCWHPENHFPYECSKPLPEDRQMELNTVLKVQNISEVYDVFKPKSEVQTREELMKMTSTSKHVWFPQGKKAYKKKKMPKDREYL